PLRQVVCIEICKPSEVEGWLAETLRTAMKKPLVGKPRRPSFVRVADAVLAGELREAHVDIDIAVAPTPEIDELLASMQAGIGAPNFVDDGRIAPALIGELFRAAAPLCRLAPWKFVHDVIRVDIPKLGVEGACAFIIGRAGKDRGILLFPSIEGFEVFLDIG